MYPLNSSISLPRLFRLYLVLLIAWLTACQQTPAAVIAPPTPPPPTTVPDPTAVLIASATPPASPTAIILPTTAPTPTTAATLPPSPTPPPLTLAIPPTWQDEITAALTTFASEWQWQLITADSPAALLTTNQAHIALVAQETAWIIHQAPLALAIPFATEWETINLEDATTILANGHELVTILPWAEMPPTHKALRVNGRLPIDPGYPFQQSWSLAAADGYETAVSQLAAHLQQHLSPPPLVHLAAVGDIMLDRALGYALQQGSLDYPFAYVAEQLRQPDITVGNVESALGDQGEAAPKSYTFRAPPQAAASLALAGFDVVSLANNHGLDYGPEALQQALELLRQQGIDPIGAGLNEVEARTAVIREVNGLRLAFLGYVHVPVEVRGFDTELWTATLDQPGLAWGRTAWIQEDVTAVRAQADVIIVVLHSGYEYVDTPSPFQAEAARTAIDAGADLVIGHHAHILQGVEFYKEGVIVYGLGNFAFEIDGPPETAILNVWLDANGVRQLEFIPAIIQFGGQPRLAESWEAGPIRQRIYQLTRSLRNWQP